jgi:hypothetical protein
VTQARAWLLAAAGFALFAVGGFVSGSTLAGTIFLAVAVTAVVLSRMAPRP